MDYSKPFEVVWLCNPCHLALHAGVRAEVRAAKAAEAKRLKERDGLTGFQIAKRMGLSKSYAYELLEDPSGEESRARKIRLAAKRACGSCGGSINLSSRRWCLECQRSERTTA